MGDVLTWLENLSERATDLPPDARPRPYWSERLSANPAEQSVLTLGATARRVRSLVTEMKEELYFAQTFGFDCVDGVGEVSNSPESELDSRVGKAKLWGSPPGEWSKDDLCDLVEVFHDLAARPKTGSYHTYNGCGWHPKTYSRRSGQAIYRWKMNLLLEQSGMGLRLADDGEDVGRIVETTPDSVAELIQDALQLDSTSQDAINHAVALYRSRDASRETKQSAVLALAGVLESRRSDLKRELLNKDERALFDIANNFGLRHRRADQRSDYREAYLDWIFCLYLGTIRLIEALKVGGGA
jgi:hypothetical protein